MRDSGEEEPRPATPIDMRGLRVCKCGPPPEMCLDDDEYVTHMTDKDGAFRNAPKLNGETDFSVCRGRLGLARAYSQVVRDADPLPEELHKNRIRHARVGDLRDAGLVVVHTPGKVRNGLHVSLVWVGEGDGQIRVPWPTAVSERLAACFTEAVPQPEEDDDA